VFNRYLERTGDLDALAALPLFLSLRAAIRAHVSAAMAKSVNDTRRRDDALAYLDMAHAFLSPAPPRLLAVGGFSGSGKSRLARDLAPFIGAAPGAVVLRTDVLRKTLMGVGPEIKLGIDGYTEEMTERTYQRLYDTTARALEMGHAVIADAVFARGEQREAIEQVGRRLGIPFDGLWLESSPEIMRQRIEKRRNNASDATVDVLDQQLTYDLGPLDWSRLNSSGSKAETLRAARAIVRP
jgi:predicted kinase